MERTIIIDIPESIKEFMALPKGVYKNIAYGKINNHFQLVSYMRDGDNHYFSQSWSYVIRYGENYLIKDKNKTGFSYKEGKLKIWFGHKLSNITHLDSFFKIMNWNFIEPEFYSYITNTALTKLFKGKITNTRDLLRSYIKSVRFDCSPELLYLAVKAKNKHGERLDKSVFYNYGKIAKNMNHVCINWSNGRIDNMKFLGDLSRQFDLLNKKIDFNWSDKRLEEEHNRATRIIMKIESENIPDHSINYPDITLPAEVEIIRTRKRLFEEGSIMKHCVYTNYWNDIKSGKYVAFHISMNGEEATLGCRLDNTEKTEMLFNQVYLKLNKTPSQELRRYCETWVSQNRFILRDFKLNLVLNKEEESVEEFVMPF